MQRKEHFRVIFVATLHLECTKSIKLLLHNIVIFISIPCKANSTSFQVVFRLPLLHTPFVIKQWTFETSLNGRAYFLYTNLRKIGPPEVAPYLWFGKTFLCHTILWRKQNLLASYGLYCTRIALNVLTKQQNEDNAIEWASVNRCTQLGLCELHQLAYYNHCLLTAHPKVVAWPNIILVEKL